MGPQSQRMLERALPTNLDAERVTLGAVLMNNEAYHRVAEVIRAEDFYLDAHRTIFRTISRLVEAKRSADLITMQDELLKEGQLDKIGGISALAGMLDGVPGMANIDHHVESIKEKSILRQAINAANRLMAACFDQSDSAAQILESAEESLFRLAERRVRTGFVRVRDMEVAACRILEKLYNDREMVTGLSTGFIDMDRMTSGLQPADLIVIAARPSMGKTALGLNIAQYVGLKKQKAVGIFSLEMSKEQLLMRMLCAQARTDAHKVRSGFLNKDDLKKLAEALSVVAQAPIYIDDSAGLNLAEMRAKCRRLAGEDNLGLVIVDYLQLMRGGGERGENRTQEISAISRGLKGLAKELNVPVIAMSQLSRAPEQRQGDHRPQLSDLRESGSIEQDADVVCFIYREEMYRPSEENKGMAEIRIAKQRNGPTGTIKLAFLSEYTRFETYLSL